MVGWETLGDAIPTDSDQFGGQYLNRISQLLTGSDIAAVDSTLAPIIGTKWTFKSGMLWMQDVAGTHTVNIIPDTQSVNVVIKTPAQSFTPDYIMLRTQAETIQNKVISGTQNTFSNIPDSALSANVDLVNTAGTISGLDTYLTACFALRNPANTFSTIVNAGAVITANNTLTLPIITDTLVGRTTTDTLSSKSISGATNTLTLIPDAALSANVALENIGNAFTGANTFNTFTMNDAQNIVLGTTTGTRIGTATTQKIGFYNKAPVIQASAIASPTSDTVGGKVAIDAIRTVLINLGLTA